MNTANLLKITFVILLLVTFGEVGYYMYFQYNSNSEKYIQEKATLTQKGIPTLIPISQPNDINKDFQKAIQILQKDIPFQTQYTLLNLASWSKRDILVSSTITTELKGKIVDLNLSGGMVEGVSGAKIPYAKKIVLISGNDQRPTKIYYKENELGVIQYFQQKNQEEVPLNPKDIKIGDTIRITDIHDFKKDQPVQVKIIKL